PQHSHPRAIVDRRVLKRLPTSDSDHLHVHLDAFAGSILLEELQLPRTTATDRAAASRYVHVLHDPANRRLGYGDLVHALEPNLRPGWAVAVIATSDDHQVDRRLRSSSTSMSRIARNKTELAGRGERSRPAPHRLPIQTKKPRRWLDSACPRVLVLDH